MIARITGRQFNPNIKHTLGIEFDSKVMQSGEVVLKGMLWDFGASSTVSHVPYVQLKARLSQGLMTCLAQSSKR